MMQEAGMRVLPMIVFEEEMSVIRRAFVSWRALETCVDEGSFRGVEQIAAQVEGGANTLNLSQVTALAGTLKMLRSAALEMSQEQEQVVPDDIREDERQLSLNRLWHKRLTEVDDALQCAERAMVVLRHVQNVNGLI
jgi:hypothetical protein